MSSDVSKLEADSEVKVTPERKTQPIRITGLIKGPSSKFEKDGSGDPRSVISVTITFRDISERNLRRLATAALSEVPIDVQLMPTIEQTEFAIES